jgi:nucleoside-diphosphate-sugar epimerase
MQFIEADNSKLSVRTYNIQGLSFSCEECVGEIKRIFPNFKFEYMPDFRDLIAKNWPGHLDDSLARKDWGWNPNCKDLKSLSDEMLKTIGK